MGPLLVFGALGLVSGKPSIGLCCGVCGAVSSLVSAFISGEVPCQGLRLTRVWMVSGQSMGLDCITTCASRRIISGPGARADKPGTSGVY